MPRAVAMLQNPILFRGTVRAFDGTEGWPTNKSSSGPFSQHGFPGRRTELDGWAYSLMAEQNSAPDALLCPEREPDREACKGGHITKVLPFSLSCQFQEEFARNMPRKHWGSMRFGAWRRLQLEECEGLLRRVCGLTLLSLMDMADKVLDGLLEGQVLEVGREAVK